MNLWKKAWRFLFGPRSEIEFVEAALKRHKRRLQELDDMFDPSIDCCPLCVDPYYYRLQEKIKRVEKQLKKLKHKR